MGLERPASKHAGHQHVVIARGKAGAAVELLRRGIVTVDLEVQRAHAAFLERLCHAVQRFGDSLLACPCF